MVFETERPRQSGLRTNIATFLADAVRGLDVLDVGCADHSAANESSPRWLHKHIVKAARSTTGLDLLESDVAKLRERGYNMVSGDACTMDLGRTFDVIIAGELIEHVDNPGGLMRNLRRHLNRNGRLIITTPNPFFLLHWFEWFLLNSKLRQRWNCDHVGWYDPFTMENLLDRHGLKIDAVHYFARSRKTLAVLRALRLPCPRPLASSFLVIARASPQPS